MSSQNENDCMDVTFEARAEGDCFSETGDNKVTDTCKEVDTSTTRVIEKELLEPAKAKRMILYYLQRENFGIHKFDQLFTNYDLPAEVLADPEIQVCVDEKIKECIECIKLSALKISDGTLLKMTDGLFAHLRVLVKYFKAARKT